MLWTGQFFEGHRSSKTRWRIVGSPTVTGDFLQCSGPVKKSKIKVFRAYVVSYLIVMCRNQMCNFLKDTGAQKPGEGLLVHPQWPVIFYNALDRSKNQINEGFRACVVSYLIVVCWDCISKFWSIPESKNPVKACWYTHSDRWFFYNALYWSKPFKNKDLELI